MITKEEAVNFLKERASWHLKAANKIKADFDIIENDVERIKYNTRIDTANKYADIATLISENIKED